MARTIAIATTVLAGAAMSLSCGSGTGALVVTSAAPTSDGDSPRPTIRIQFADPVIEPEQVGTTVAHPPVRIEPAVAVEGYWVDRYTLNLIPLADLAASTRYEVSLTGTLAARTDRYHFSFVHQPLAVEGLWGVDATALPPRPRLPIHFNQKVDPAQVIAHCQLVRDGKSTTRLTLVSAASPSTRVIVSPVSDLDQGQAYELTCTHLSGIAGPEPLTTPFHASVRTYARAAVQRVVPGGRDVPTDELRIEVQFASPVSLDEVRRNLSSKPAIAGLDRGLLDATGTRYRATVNLETTTDYEITLDGHLRDQYGQTLGRPYQHAFTTGEARPRLDLETGIYALEPTEGGYPVWARNLDHFDVDCASLAPDDVVRVLTADIDYDPWYNSDSVIDWNALGLSHHTTRVEIDHKKDNWQLTRLDLASMCSGDGHGLFLAEVSSDQIRLEDYSARWQYHNHRRVLADVTGLGVLMHTGSTSGIIWVTSLATGKPVAGAHVALYSAKGKKVFTGTSDAQGLLRTPGANQLLSLDAGQGSSDERPEMSSWQLFRARRLIAVVEHDGDMSVVDGNWNDGIQAWNYNVSDERRVGRTLVRGFMHSDRGIYRPGETAHIKGLVRVMEAGRAPRVPHDNQVDVKVEDGRGREVLSQRVPVSGFGGFHVDVPLTPSATLGDYFVTATIAGQSFRQRFSVEEFRKLSFEVEARPAVKHTELGAKMSFSIAADYLFGSPVEGAAVRWTVERRPHGVSFDGFDGYAFEDYTDDGFDSWWYYGDHEHYGSFVSDGKGKTDAGGRFSFSVTDPYKNLDGPYDYIATAEVTDVSNQTVSKRAMLTAHPTDFYVGVDGNGYVHDVGEPFDVSAVAVRPDGSRTATKATLSLIRQDWKCTYEGGYHSYPVCHVTRVPVLDRHITIPRTGKGVEKVLANAPGEYVVRVDTVDSRGRKVSASTWLWILGKGHSYWGGDESSRLTLIADKKQYEPGDVARLVPRTGMDHPTALITVERDGIVDAQVRTLDSPSEGLSIPLKAEYAPNVYASVALVTGRRGKGDARRPRFKLGIVDLPVSADQHRLDVAVKTDRKSYQPGDPVTGTIEVTSHGKPVRAEVSLSVADEGVLQLVGFETPDPMKAFYASFGLGVDAATNWNRIARLNDPLGYDADEGGDSPGRDEGVRSRFVSSAYWNPSIVTGADGRAHFRFEAPDDLTAFRVMAVAADKGGEFGSGDRRFTVAKRLMATPALPRFVTAGDDFMAAVVIHNHTGKPGRAHVTASGSGLTFARTSQDVAVSQSRRVVFPVKIAARETAETARVRFTVTMGKDRDAVEVSLPIERGLQVSERTLAAGVLDSAQLGSVTVPVRLAPHALPDQSSLSITIDRTGLAELEPALQYLVEYPYGCLEQTLSRFVPLAKAKDLAASVGMTSLAGKRMETFLRAGADKVVRHQSSSGQFSLWPNGRTYPHLTVYACYGLMEARRAGVDIDEQALDRGLDAISRWTSEADSTKPGGNLGTAAMAAFVLADAGRPDAGLIARLYKARAGLPRYGLAFLLRAMARADSPRSDQRVVENELLAGVKLDGNRAVVVERLSDADRYMSTDTRSTAMALSALLATDPHNPVIDELAEGLRSSRLDSGRWLSTQENVYGLIALADFARAQKDGVTDVRVTGPVDQEHTLRGSRAVRESVPAATAAGKSLRITARGRARYSVRMRETFREGLTRPESAGFTVERQYRTRTGEPVTHVHAGDLLVVHVEVVPDADRRWVAVVDHLPAGFEAVNTRLASSASSVDTSSSWRWTHTEVRDDQVQAFADYSRKGHPLVLEYLVRATTTGTFSAMPATAEAMYEPTVHGRTVKQKVTIK